MVLRIYQGVQENQDMTTIDTHTFDSSRLNGGWVIDAGCRGFKFTNYCLDRSKVYALDIEDFTDSLDVSLPGKYFSKFIFKHAALAREGGKRRAYFFGDGTANFLEGINDLPGDYPDRPLSTKTVDSVTLEDIYSEIGTDIDLLKMDIEGAEYEILETIKPIPKQITVEFHEHCHPALHEMYINRVMGHLCKYYDCQLHIRDWPRYHYMDCLFIRKDLV